MISFLGDWLTTVAVLTIVDDLSTSALAISGVLIAQTLPIFLISPVAGPLADRVDRRVLMVITDVVRASLVVVMLLAYWTGSVWLVVAALTVRTTAGGFFIPARSASVPELASGRSLPVAMALMAGTWSVMLALGAGLGGLLTAVVGVEGALIVDGLTFLFSAMLLWGLPSLPPRDEHSEVGTSFLDGIRTLRGRVYLTCLLLLRPALAVTGAVLVALPSYAGGVFAGIEGPLFLGVLYASRGLGALIGSMGLRKVLGDAIPVLQWSIVPAFLGLGGLFLLMAIAPTFWLSALALVLGTIGSGMVWTSAGTLVQLSTEREVRGRLFALEFGLMMLLSSLASLLGGLAMDAGLSPRALVALSGLFCFPPALAWFAVLRWAPGVRAARAPCS